jgi:hypothetical protein
MTVAQPFARAAPHKPTTNVCELLQLSFPFVCPCANANDAVPHQARASFSGEVPSQSSSFGSAPNSSNTATMSGGFERVRRQNAAAYSPSEYWRSRQPHTGTEASGWTEARRTRWSRENKSRQRRRLILVSGVDVGAVVQKYLKNHTVSAAPPRRLVEHRLFIYSRITTL